MTMQYSRVQPRFFIRAVAATLLACATFSSAQEPVTESEPEQAQQIEDDMVFAADDELRLDAKSSDDVFAAGNSIDVNGATADHLIMAGGEISITDASAEDLIVAGGEIDFVNGVVADDIVAAGGEIVIGSGFTIGGSAVLAGGSARINAPIPGDLRVMSDNVVLNSAVGGNVRLTADNVEIGPNARIAGDLEYRSDKLEIQPGAVVEGETRILPVSETYAVEDLSKGAGGFFLMLGLSILVSYFVVVIALVFAAPGLMRATSRMMQEQPWKSLGLGLLIAVIVPVLGIVMVWSVVGVPVAVLLFTASIAITPIALATTAYFAGDGARRLLTSNKEAATGIGARLLWPGLGALVIFALTLIPLVGLVVWLLAMLFGLGAVANSAGKALAKSA